jgi:hypothetical protein
VRANRERDRKASCSGSLGVVKRKKGENRLEYDITADRVTAFRLWVSRAFSWATVRA